MKKRKNDYICVRIIVNTGKFIKQYMLMRLSYAKCGSLAINA